MRKRSGRMYAFSQKCVCGYCGHALTRRTRQQDTKSYKPVWQCKNATSNGIASCPDCKSIDENVLESAFLDVLRQLIDHYDDIMDSILLTINTALSSDDVYMRPAQLDNRIKKLETERNLLTENLLDDIIDREAYDQLTAELKNNKNRTDPAPADDSSPADSDAKTKICSSFDEGLKNTVSSGESHTRRDRRFAVQSVEPREPESLDIQGLLVLWPPVRRGQVLTQNHQNQDGRIAILDIETGLLLFSVKNV